MSLILKLLNKINKCKQPNKSLKPAEERRAETPDVGTAGPFYPPQSAGSLHTPETCRQEREVTEQASSTNGRSLERPTWVVTGDLNLYLVKP